MANSNAAFVAISDRELLSATRELVRKAGAMEADLLVHLGEIDQRRLYRDCAFPSMLAFCVHELGFSEDAAFRRIFVARAARRLPAIVEALRSGRVHLAGLRLLVPLLSVHNVDAVLAQAAGKSKREIEELVARLEPKPAVPARMWKLPARSDMASATQGGSLAPSVPETESTLAAAVATPSDGLPEWSFALSMPSAPPPRHRPVIAPLSEDTFKIQFTMSRAQRDKLRRAQDLLRHRIPDGDPAAIFEKALDLLIERIEKERFGLGRKPRPAKPRDPSQPATRYVPADIRRAVTRRDEGRCTFVDERGNRCAETGGLEFDHVEGFARHPVHTVKGIRLRCKAHNGLAAERMYGREFMERARTARKSRSTCPGTSSDTECTSKPTECSPQGPERSERQT